MKAKVVLLVDDEASIRAMAEEGLPLFGYEVLTASSGEEALEVFAEHRTEIALVVLDLLMPGMGGERCFEELKRIAPELKVILTSGRSVPTKLLERASGLLAKPFSLRSLVEAIEKALGPGA